MFPQKCGTNSTSPACICTDENKEALQACVNCAVGDDPALTGQFSALINGAYLFFFRQYFPSLRPLIHVFSFLDWKAVCNSDISLPSATPNTAGTTPQSTPNTAGVGDASGTTRDISHD